MNHHSVGSGLHVHRERTARVEPAPLGLQGQATKPQWTLGTALYTDLCNALFFPNVCTSDGADL